MELKNNQSAILLEASEDGEISVNIASPDIDGLTGRLCVAVAKKIMEDANFQSELMGMIDEDI
jgi:hypothetical protein